MKEREYGFLMVLAWLAILAFWGGAIFVLLHFIAKWW